MAPSWAAVIFDLDDTLIIEEATARASIRTATSVLCGVEPSVAERVVLESAQRLWRSGPYHSLCLELGFASWEGLWSDFSGCHGRVDRLRAWAPSYRVRAWRAALATLGFDDPALAEEVGAAFIAAQRDGHTLVDGAGPVVRGLAGTYQLGLLTNGPADIQRHKLERTGLAECFDTVVISGHAGVGKPSAEVFELALEALGVPPVAAVMVGDSWDRDVQGAGAAGLSAIWVRGDRALAAHDGSVPSVSSVRDLSRCLAQGAVAGPGNSTATLTPGNYRL